jgi:twinkle protein
MSETFTYEYLPWRGISKDTMRFYDVKTKIDSEGKPVEIGFKYPAGGYKVRSIEKKDFRTDNWQEKPGLFGRDKFSAGSHKYVTITEGELDALSLYQVLRSPVVSVPSSSSARVVCGQDRSWLQSFERIYLAFDNDEAGRRAEAEVAKLFDFNKVWSVRFTRRKDANEHLQLGEENELLNIWHNSKKYLPENVISSFSEFEKILGERTEEGVSYPFDTLNHMTYGIRKGESVLITAQEGVGKTEVMHAIEHHLLKTTTEPVGAIFLEEPKRRHLQALVGIQLQKPVHLPDSGVDDVESFEALRQLVGEDDRLHVYSHFGSDDPDDLLDTIRFLVTARGCGYVLLDHISMVVSGLAGEDERRALDYFSTRLEMMVKELNFALIFVSHVNDSGQTRGSRYISKVCDVRIDATRDLTNLDDRTRAVVELSISKNRPIGRTGPAGRYHYDQYTRQYTEIFGDVLPSSNDWPPSAVAA